MHAKKDAPNAEGSEFHLQFFFVGSEFSGKMLGPTSVRVEMGKCEYRHLILLPGKRPNSTLKKPFSCAPRFVIYYLRIRML